MRDAQVFPNGMAWCCSACHEEYPEDYEPDFCECGHLTRIMLTFSLDSVEPSDEIR